MTDNKFEWRLRGQILYGYDKTPEKVVIVNREEADCVRFVFKRYWDDGISIPALTAEINQLDYKTKKGKDFKNETIYRILDNHRRYEGCRSEKQPELSWPVILPKKYPNRHRR